ncbi:aspartic ase precursor [Fusarium beomiforme]|uniref:Aspartic ase n=1 Tax=Fusarium beomiforme TaxID=44412 RepID=A0A9P5ASQ1_9HYPO|nr:aspartic ase precursor [Fusarium beomiforme]
MLFATTFILSAAATAVSAQWVNKTTNTLQLKHVIKVSSMKNIVEKGKSRVRSVNTKGSSRERIAAAAVSGAITNEDVTYVASIVIGGQTWDLIIDTGSSNTWCGAQEPCEPTSTGNDTGASVAVKYGSGSFSGVEYIDAVSFNNLTVHSQSIGAATNSNGFTGVDGIIGFGPVDLTENTVSNANQVPTFMHNLYKQGSIPSNVLGVYFRPESGRNNDDTNGELTLGGVDTSKFVPPLTYFPTLTRGEAAQYWGISVNTFTYGRGVIGRRAQAIVDTGTTLIYVPTGVYNNFLKAAGGKTDGSSGLATFTKKPTSNFGISFTPDGVYNLRPDQYLVPEAQYDNFGLARGKYYAWIADGGTGGVNTIIGQKFLENYYSVFDTTKSRIGFSKAL